MVGGALRGEYGGWGEEIEMDSGQGGVRGVGV